MSELAAARQEGFDMGVHIVSKHLGGDVVVIAQDVYKDDRGFFMEVFRADQFRALGLPDTFVQDNHSCSKRGVVRGLHLQWEPPMGKLMRVTRGRGFLVAVDVRKGSPTFGQWYGLETSAEERNQVWAPAGFARGFCALTESTEIQYKTTGIYNNQCEATIRWNDPEIGIRWPVDNPQVSERDRKALTLAEWRQTPHSELLK
jgi:dTDP-4-dehydrorhamnose 3,5-epimerase